MNEKSKQTGAVAPRWSDPFQAFRAEMDRMFDSYFGDRSPMPRFPAGDLAKAGGGDGFIVPSVDIKESDKEVTLTAELPGMEEKDVDLSVHDGLITLKGEKKYEHVDDKDEVHMVERRYGSFQRSFRLPDSVDTDKIDAKFEKGVLRVVMPKKAEAVSPVKKIAIGGQ